MRTLGIHSNFFRMAAHDKAMPSAEPLTEKKHEIEHDCIVVFISVEKCDEADPEKVARILVANTIERSKTLDCNTVVVYPYVHLTEDPSDPRSAMRVLKTVEAGLQTAGLDVHRTAFGWYKSFEVSAKGHPLSEWSGRFTPADEETTEIKIEVQEKKPKREGSQFSEYYLVDIDGEAYPVTAENFKKSPVLKKKEPLYQMLRQFVQNELGSGTDTKGTPKHITYMRQHELVDYCEVSEKGHYKWYPKGLLIQKLILDYAARLAFDWGASEMKNPILIKSDNNIVGQLMGEFHERDYQVDGGRGICYLRYASDPLAFPFMQQTRFSHKQSPLKVYEEASCFRNEQEGEVSGLKRVRNFMMTDMHAACATVEQAKEQFEILCFKFGTLMDDIIAKGRWVLGWEGTVDFFNENRDWLISIGSRMHVPAFFKLMPKMSHYYAIKNEYQSITEDKSNIQVSTVQWDVKDGERFDIGFFDETGRKKPCPVILHASSFGSIERTLCTILENIAIDQAAGVPPMFPVWLSPTQARVINVTEDHLDFAAEVCQKLTAANIRADLDDRDDTVSKKIRNGEKEWIPYLLVVGEKEQSTGEFTVRYREDKSQTQMTLDEFIERVRKDMGDMPYRPLPLPQRLTHRPIFFG